MNDSKIDYRGVAQYSFLNDLFITGKYNIIKKLYYYNNKYLEYFKFRINIIEKNNKEILEEYDKILILINNLDLNLYISTLFHFGKYMFDCRKYNEAREIFFKLYEATKGEHLKAKEYLELIEKEIL